MIKQILFSGLVLSILVSQQMNAQLLQQYNFTGATGSEVTNQPDGQPLNGSLSAIRRGSVLQPSGAGGTFSSKGFKADLTADTGAYVAFAVMANSGFQLKLDSLVFGQRRSNTGPKKIEVRSSLDNYTASIFQDSGTVVLTWNNKIITGSSFQSVPGNQPVEFRFYGYGASSTNGTWRLDSIRVYGNITSGGVAPRPKIRFSPASVNFTESNGVQNASVKLTSPPSVNISATVVLKSGTASTGTDYVAFAATPVSFSTSGTTTVQIPVNFLDDAVQEPTETLSLVLRKTGLSSDTAFDLGSDSVFTFSINDNDAIAPPPSGPPTRTISQIVGNSTGNQADSVGKNVRIFGTIYGLNQRLSATGGGYQMFIRNGTSGIGIFKTAPVSGISTLNEGDSVRIMGKIECFRGLSQINPDSMVVLATGMSLKNPDPIISLSESQEANLVSMLNMVINPATWATGSGTGFTAKAFNGTDTIAVRIDNDCPLFNAPVPTGTLRITGMVGQFVPGTPTPVAPFPASGYQLIPRKTSDIEVINTVDPRTSAQHEIRILPNPGQNQVRISGIQNQEGVLQICNLQGKILMQLSGAEQNKPLDVSALPAGIYLFRFSETGRNFRWVKTEK